MYGVDAHKQWNRDIGADGASVTRSIPDTTGVSIDHASALAKLTTSDEPTNAYSSDALR